MQAISSKRQQQSAAVAAAVVPIWRRRGGKDASKIADALEKAKEIIAEQMK